MRVRVTIRQERGSVRGSFARKVSKYFLWVCVCMCVCVCVRACVRACVCVLRNVQTPAWNWH